jgi:hypothetical protein
LKSKIWRFGVVLNMLSHFVANYYHFMLEFVPRFTLVAFHLKPGLDVKFIRVLITLDYINSRKSFKDAQLLMPTKVGRIELFRSLLAP